MALTSPHLRSDDEVRHRELSDKLDTDIARVRAEIQNLTQRKHLLTSSLLSSTKVQSFLQKRKESSQENLPTELTPLQTQAQHNETNIHRLAYGVTSFPFTDPNPDTSDRPLLGIRFDIPSRSGQFQKAPYYIFLKRIHDDSNTTSTSTNTSLSSNTHDLKIHHHTIPALVPLQDYEARYLPRTTASENARTVHGRDEGYFSPSPTDEHVEHGTDNETSGAQPSSRRRTHSSTATNVNKPSQDLHALVAAVRHDLMSWNLRNEAISLLSEQLGLSSSHDNSDHDMSTAKFSLQTIGATALDARFCRLVWRNGTVGRLRLTDDGYVDRAVVIGDAVDPGRMDRMKDIERILRTGKDGRPLHIEKLIERLEQVESRMNRNAEREGINSVGVDGMDIDETNMTVEI